MTKKTDTEEAPADDLHFPPAVPLLPSKTSIVAPTLEWPHAAVLVAKLQFGMGILGIPSTLLHLGLVPGVALLCILSAINMYAGLLVSQIRARHPAIQHVGDVGEVMFGRAGAELMGLTCWVFMLLVGGTGMLTVSIALNVLTKHGACTVLFVGATAAAAFMIGAPLRKLHRVSWLGWIGMACVVCSVWILVVTLLVHPPDGVRRPSAFVTGGADFAESANAIGVQSAALMGNVAFYAVSAEMRRPDHFPRAVVAGQAFVMLQYLVIGLLVTFAAGQRLVSPALRTAGPTMERVCFAVALPGLLVSTLLFSNLAAKYLYTRIALRRRSSSHSDAGDAHWSARRQWIVWLASYAVVLLLGFLTASAIPIFDQLMGFTGALVGPLFTMIITGLTKLYLIQPGGEADEGGAIGTERRRGWMAATWRTMRIDRTSAVVGTLCIALVLLGMLLTVGGVMGSVMLIIRAYRSSAIAAAFSCANNAGRG